MPKAARTHPSATIGVVFDIEDDVVGSCSIPTGSGNSSHRARGCHVIEPECVPYPPSDIVVSTGGVATHSNPAGHDVFLTIESQAAPKDVHPTYAPADHRIHASTESFRRSGIGHGR